MKKWLSILMVTALLAVMVTGSVVAQGTVSTKAPGTWSSSINIQNVGSGDATVVITFYNSSGTAVLSHTVSPVIAGGGSRSLYVPTDIPGLSDGQYSVVVSSNEEIQVVANAASSSPYTSGSYNGIGSSGIGMILNFPGLYKNYYAYYSEVVLQNTEADQASVTLRFYNQNTGAQVGGDINATIPGNSSRVFALQDLSSLPSGNTNGLFSLQVTSNRNLAGVANIWSTSFQGLFSDYNAYVSGSTTVYAPALYKNYYSYVSSLTVQNIDSAAANVKITYSNGVTENVTLQPRTAKEYYQPSKASLPSGNVNGVFSAKVECTNGQDIVVLVNIQQNDKGYLASYNGPSSSTSSVNAPVVLKMFYGWYSAVTVQNVGTSSTNITITYASAGSPSRTFNNIAANGTVNIIQLAGAGENVLPDGSSVSAVISSSGQPIVAVVQEDSVTAYGTHPGDYLLAYTGNAR
jgi:hypothetical protein